MAQLYPESALARTRAAHRNIDAILKSTSDSLVAHDDTLIRIARRPRHTWFSQMERFIKLGALQERRADKALNKLRKLQRDRFAALEVQGEIYYYGKELSFSKVLPIADLRTADLNKISAGLIALSLLATIEEAKAIAQTKPTAS